MQHELGIFEGSPKLFTDPVIDITDRQIWDEKLPVKDGFHFLSNDYPPTGNLVLRSGGHVGWVKIHAVPHDKISVTIDAVDDEWPKLLDLWNKVFIPELVKLGLIFNDDQWTINLNYLRI